MFQFHSSAAPEREGTEGGDRWWTPATASRPTGDPEGLDLWAELDWKPVSSAYDWYGEADPDGLADDADPLGGVVAPVSPAGKEGAEWPLGGTLPPEEAW